MRPHKIDQDTLRLVEGLVAANFSARDDLYAAAKALDDDALAEICRRLAENLGGNAADLQQWLMSAGEEPSEPSEVVRRLQQVVIQLLKERHGSTSVLAEVETSEHELKERYDQAIENAEDSDVEELLRRQRDDVEFGERVINKVKGNVVPPEDPETAK